MFSFIQAILRHMYLAITFKHNGKGLPDKREGVYWALCAVYIAGSVVRSGASPEGNIVAAVIAALIVLALFGTLLPATQMAAAMLVTTSMSLLTALLFMAGLNPAEGGLYIMLAVWEVLAIIVILSKVRKNVR